MSLEVGRTLSHYRLIEKIGQGGMGVVWRAEDTVLGRTVAIKVLPAEVSRDAKRREMFLEEAQLASQVSAAHIVQVYEFGREGDLDFIVMEYVEGNPLSKILHGRPLPPHKVADFGHQIAHALSRAHRKNLLHRDLKPANVIVTPDGEVKVLDFGLATLLESSDTVAPSQATTELSDGNTSPAGLAGTLAYMSPEQARREKLDARSDVFSLGTMLYEMTTGQLPFAGPTSADVLESVQRARPKPVHEIVPQVPLELDRIIQKALASHRRDRYQSMEDLEVDLSRLGRELESGSLPSYQDLAKTAAPRSRITRWLIGIAGALALAVIALGVWWGGSADGLDEKTVLVLPFKVSGPEGADYLGQACAEAVAISLAQYPSLRIPPLPETTEGERPDLTGEARAVGAGRVVTGTVIREGDSVRATLQLIDANDNRIVWGTQREVSQDELPSLGVLLAEDLAPRFGAVTAKLYDYPRPENLTGSPAMARSNELAEIVLAWRTSDRELLLDKTERLVSRFPGEPDAHVLRCSATYGAWFWDHSRDRRAALEGCLDFLDRVDPNNPYSDIYRAFILSEGHGLLHEEEHLLIRQLKRDDISPAVRSWILRNLGGSASEAGRDDTALEMLGEAVELDPLHDSNHGILGLVLIRAGRFADAVQAYERALALNPSSPLQMYGLGNAFYHAGQPDRALAPFRESCEMARARKACAMLAVILLRTGQREEAIDTASKAASLPDDGTGDYDLARFSALMGDAEKSLKYLMRQDRFFVNHPDLRTDPDFATLRGRPEFDAVVDKVENLYVEE